MAKDTPAPQTWPADKIIQKTTAELLPFLGNARAHSDGQVAQLVKSIEEWGWTMPVLIDEAGGIIAGHGRVMAANRMGLTEVPCVIAAGWSEEKKRAYVLADNKIAENATWDVNLLAGELAAIAALDFDLGLIGFEESEIDALLAEKTVLPQKTVQIRPMKMTHVLISVPNVVGLDFMKDALAEAVRRGGRVDYGGN